MKKTGAPPQAPTQHGGPVAAKLEAQLSRLRPIFHWSTGEAAGVRRMHKSKQASFVCLVSMLKGLHAPQNSCHGLLSHICRCKPRFPPLQPGAPKTAVAPMKYEAKCHLLTQVALFFYLQRCLCFCLVFQVDWLTRRHCSADRASAYSPP